MPLWLPMLLAFVFVSAGVYLALNAAAAPRQTARRGLDSLGIPSATLRAATPTAAPPGQSRREALNQLTRDWRRFDMYRTTEVSLARAGWALKPVEYGIMVAVVGFLFGAALWFLSESILLAMLAVVVGVFAVQFFLKMAIARRLRKFESQLPDALELMAASLRSGHGFQRALQVTAEDMPSPISDEFKTAVQDVSLGMTVEEALRAIQTRVPTYEMELIVTAVGIQMQVGGNLSEILDKIAATLRERAKIRGEIATLTAEGRLSAWIILLMPIVLFFWLCTSNPTYMKPLTQEAAGHFWLGIALVMQLIGMFIIWKMLQMEV